MRVLGIIALAGLAGCATYEPTPDVIAQGRAAAPPRSEEAAEKAVSEYFAAQLFDPYSARYEIVQPINSYKTWFASDPMHGWFVCGTVNAKNRMGGYVGASPFWAFFDPANPDAVINGYIWERDDWGAGGNCEDIKEHQTGVEWKPVSADAD